MKQPGLSFHRPAAFWLGCALIAGGVLSHGPMFMMGQHTHWQMVGMPMTTAMWVGMAIIPLGLALSAYGMLPRAPAYAGSDGAPLNFHVADGAPLNRAHWALVTVLVITLAIDVMKPATLGFVMPGMTAEYGMGTSLASLLALFALTGTAIGSVVWGRIADRFGRRSAILLSALMFIGTAICGAMPTFGWNLAMCFLMGASAGGLLPITFTLMTETVPAAHRGWLLVALGGLGTSGGYLLAAGAAAILEPMFSWRVLWLLGLPTGALIIVLNRFIPESPRFLSSMGLHGQARALLERFAGRRGGIERDDETHPGAPVIDESHPVTGVRQLLRGRHAAVSWSLLVAGTAWGLVNFGFLLWLPVNLRVLGVDPAGASALLAWSAVYALPGIALVIWIYHRWSSFKSLVLFLALTAASLLAFGALDALAVRSVVVTTLATAALLVSVSGVIAMLIPYAAEIYPLHLRGTGSGVVAASSKFGGILGAGLGVAGFFDHFAVSAVLLALPMAAAALMLWRSGVETRGRRLEEIETCFSRS
ncbi:MFS transporter [Novilysobacter spongiicola]|uniref:MFS transporter, putative metabolite:H+ symporter n=1 Tax=Lysobacter spongiicola DSM 21749 TaxID=1122188 RepID=A0A1T4S9V7_9GAMM|nr:MFS transporter [Lysobacter spongiicola]SKA24985.1 MFS transporter, putative metabolite:H+ symporter [Lysobacter spongiicola DSM 21749]